MKNEEILKKAIEKAIKNGLNDWGEFEDIIWGVDNVICIKFFKRIFSSYEELIYNNNFAKAFFQDFVLMWEDYLQNMVLEKDPIKYLEKFL